MTDLASQGLSHEVSTPCSKPNIIVEEKLPACMIKGAGPKSKAGNR